MFSVSREFTFCYGHRLLDYNGKCAHLHGHNGRIIITLESETLDGQGMVLDFTDLKRSLGDWLDRTVDHRMILRKDDPLVPILQEQGEPLFLMDESPTAENLARLVFELAKSQGLPVRSVQFWETDKCSAEYREYPDSTR